MMLKDPEYLDYDVLVIGGGGAGLRSAIQIRETGSSVLIVSKSRVGLANNTILSKATFVGATGLGDERDNPEVHIDDTLKAGRFINDLSLLKRVAQKAMDEVMFLEKCGVSFKMKTNKLAIDWVPGHTYPRHVFVENRIGSNLTFPLRKYASSIGVSFMEGVLITRLLTNAGRCIGAMGISKEGRFLVFTARAIVLTTGGFSQIFLHTNNAPGITGDGHALAFHHGVALRDMEFVQFYPTSLGSRLFPYEVFVSRYGAPLRNSSGVDVVEKYNLKKNMALTRDRLAWAIMKEVLDERDVEGGVIMDLRSIPEKEILRHRHHLPHKTLLQKREFVVRPTAHFSMGGIVVDEEARASMPGLFACGESTGGMHGANRLAGNALSEVFTLGRVAGNNASLLARESKPEKPDPGEVAAEKRRLDLLFGEPVGNVVDLIYSLKEVAWDNVGIIRHKRGLEKALEKIKRIRSLSRNIHVSDTKGLIKLLELDSMLLVTEITSRAALHRCESRGAHFREDYPEENPNWRASLFIVNEQGTILIDKRPIQP